MQFRTTSGSRYTAILAGTSRQEANGRAHPTSSRTLFVSPKDALRVLSSLGNGYKVASAKPEKLTLRQRGLDNVVIDCLPAAVGLHPVELWDDKSFHVGTEIVEVIP